MQCAAFFNVNRDKFAMHCKFIAIYSYFCNRLQIFFKL